MAVRRSLKNWLETEFPHVLVKEAGNGKDAITIVKASLPDIIILDIGLPHMNGIDTVREIKSLSPDAKIVMLTIYEDDAHKKDAKSAGADAYIPKRLMQTELLPALELSYRRPLPTPPRNKVEGKLGRGFLYVGSPLYISVALGPINPRATLSLTISAIKKSCLFGYSN